MLVTKLKLASKPSQRIGFDDSGPFLLLTLDLQAAGQKKCECYVSQLFWVLIRFNADPDWNHSICCSL